MEEAAAILGRRAESVCACECVRETARQLERERDREGEGGREEEGGREQVVGGIQVRENITAS